MNRCKKYHGKRNSEQINYKKELFRSAVQTKSIGINNETIPNITFTEEQMMDNVRITSPETEFDRRNEDVVSILTNWSHGSQIQPANLNRQRDIETNSISQSSGESNKENNVLKIKDAFQTIILYSISMNFGRALAIVHR
ncbi:hypothetical protein ACOME3_000833 [Neoechinorhynchus agilis]